MSTPEPQPVVNTDVAASRTKDFFRRNKSKFVGTAITLGGAAAFALGRRSKDVVEGIDIDVKTPDSSED